MLSLNQVIKDSEAQRFATEAARSYMISVLGGDEELCEALIPDYPIMCRRVTPAPGYLESLMKPNVELWHSAKVRKVTADGICLESGETLRRLDAIIEPSGFGLSF